MNRKELEGRIYKLRSEEDRAKGWRAFSYGVGTGAVAAGAASEYNGQPREAVIMAGAAVVSYVGSILLSHAGQSAAGQATTLEAAQYVADQAQAVDTSASIQ